MRQELRHRCGQLPAQFLPGLGIACLASGTRHDQVPRSQNLIQFDGLGHALAGCERFDMIVCRIAAQAEVLHPAAHFLRIRNRPAKVRRIEFDRLVADLRHFAERARQVLRQRLAHRVELQADRTLFRRRRAHNRRISGEKFAAGGRSEQRGRNRARKGEKRRRESEPDPGYGGGGNAGQ